MSKSNRRDFLKASAAAGVAATVSTAGAFAAGNETIKIGLIGCGGRGTGALLDSLHAEQKINGANPKTEIVAVGDAFKHKADDLLAAMKSDDAKKNKFLPFAAQIKVTPDTAFGGLDAYEKVLKAGVDLVILATPPGFRPLHLEAAIRADKNIFCEKPVAVDATGARKCYALADESEKKKNIAIVAGTQRRHQKGYLETIAKLHHDKAIGEFVSARCSWNGSPIWFHDRDKGKSDAEYQLNNWYHFLWLCGDHIVEQHVHNLDVINWVVGDHPTRAIGMGGRTIRKSGDPNQVGQIWDHFAVEYEYKSGLRMFSYCRQVPGGQSDVSETVYGTKGRCNLRDGEWSINREPSGSDDISPYVREHIDLLNSIRAGKPLNELRQVTDSTFTAILGRNASYAENWLKWDDALAAAEDTMPKGLTMESALKVTPSPIPGAWRLPPKA
jgi:myo-inositol 2-dehydrogenase / D-chiro-inositol 1-dehydrogenase